MTNRERKLKEMRRLERESVRLKKEGTDAAINILQVLPIYVLGYKYGFGNLRIERFVHELYRLTEKVKDNEHLLTTMINELENDKGISIDISTGNIDNLWRDDGDVLKVIRKAGKKG